ncbi:ABC transporter permease subunit [Candidatus Berkelbacteria bacterium]|nr:ABC transporter permease subunit [Candidatus Berkelbacteria bacterium]
MRIFWESLRERQRSILAWMIGFIAFCGLLIAFFNEFPDLSFYDEIIAQAPEIFSALVGELTTLTTIEGFLSAELFSLMFPVMMAVLGISLATSLIAKEENAGTLELLLARPVSRAKIFNQKMLSLVFQLALMMLACWASIVLFTSIYNVEINAVNLAWALVALYLLTLDFSMLAFALSNIFNRGIGMAISGALFVVSYFVSNLSAFISSLDKIKDFSFFTYYRHYDLLTNGANYADLLVLLVPILVFYWLAQAAFERRDIGL